MEKDHRNKLKNRVTPIQLYKLTPKTNCGECGFASCLAFATQVVVGQGDINSCPHLEENEIKSFREQLAEQLKEGIGVKREGFQKALDYLRAEIKKSNLALLAPTLGVTPMEVSGQAGLQLIYYNTKVVVTVDDVSASSGEQLDPWEKIFIYNYVIGGAVDPSGEWVGMESLPNSVSKIKSLRAHCEEALAKACARKLGSLPGIVTSLGGILPDRDGHVDFMAEFPVLPKLSLRILWWDEEPEEGFEPRVKFLFDSRVLETIDIESLLFACEQLTDRLLSALGN